MKILPKSKEDTNNSWWKNFWYHNIHVFLQIYTRKQVTLKWVVKDFIKVKHIVTFGWMQKCSIYFFIWLNLEPYCFQPLINSSYNDNYEMVQMTRY